MTSRPSQEAAPALAAIVAEYRVTGNLGTLMDRVHELAREHPPEEVAEATRPFRDMPEVIIPAYEHVVAQRPSDAQAAVLLANAYWVTGRGPEIVGALASQAIAADATNRGAWHLWALAEPEVRERVERWREVTRRFPEDQLARAALADNATSLAGAEHDPLALDLAIATYDSLLAEATHPQQRAALETALATLRGWKL